MKGIQKIKSMKRKKCILCGNSIFLETKAENVCNDCEKENIESRYLSSWQL